MTRLKYVPTPAAKLTVYPRSGLIDYPLAENALWLSVCLVNHDFEVEDTLGDDRRMTHYPIAATATDHGYYVFGIKEECWRLERPGRAKIKIGARFRDTLQGEDIQ